MKQVEAAGVQRLPRITGVADGQPIADGAAVPRPTTVICATGYRPGLDWIAGLPFDDAQRGGHAGLITVVSGVERNFGSTVVNGM